MEILAMIGAVVVVGVVCLVAGWLVGAVKITVKKD